MSSIPLDVGIVDPVKIAPPGASSRAWVAGTSYCSFFFISLSFCIFGTRREGQPPPDYKNYYSRLNFRHNQKTDRSNRVASSADDQTTCRIQVVNILLGKDNRVSTLLQRKITIRSKSSQ